MKYTIQTTQDRVFKGEHLIQNNGGRVYNDNSFEISGVEGYYSFNNDVLTIVIISKPWLASWDMIENKIKDFFR